MEFIKDMQALVVLILKLFGLVLVRYCVSWDSGNDYVWKVEGRDFLMSIMLLAYGRMFYSKHNLYNLKDVKLFVKIGFSDDIVYERKL